MFRFTKKEVKQLRKLFLIPDKVRVGHSVCLSGDWAFVLFLSVMCGTKLATIGDNFGIHANDVSKFFNFVLRLVTSRPNLINWFEHPNREKLLSSSVLSSYVQSISAKAGIPLDTLKFWGFVDGTNVEVCRPGGRYSLQESVYDGKDKAHALAYLVCNSPSGFILYASEPYEGRHNDMHIQKDSGLQQYHVYSEKDRRSNVEHYKISIQMDESFLASSLSTADKEYRDVFLYGDKGFKFTNRIIAPFSLNQLRRHDHTNLNEMNERMKEVRISVEWMMRIIKIVWPILLKKLRVFLQPVHLIWMAACILTNCRNICRPNEISQYFHCVQNITLEDLFQDEE